MNISFLQLPEGTSEEALRRELIRIKIKRVEFPEIGDHEKTQAYFACLTEEIVGLKGKLSQKLNLIDEKDLAKELGLIVADEASAQVAKSYSQNLKITRTLSDLEEVAKVITRRIKVLTYRDGLLKIERGHSIQMLNKELFSCEDKQKVICLNLQNL